MKHIKKIVAAVVAVTLVAVLFAQIFPANAATNGVQKKLDELRAVYSTGTYFTADGNACYSNQTDNCRLSNIPSRGGLPSGASVAAVLGESWSCRSFANYAFYYIFGEAYWNLSNTGNPVLGDFVLLNGGRHSVIYLSEDSNYYYVYDSNGDSTNVVYYNRAFSKSYWYISGAYHAKSYDKVMNEGGDAVVATTVPTTAAPAEPTTKAAPAEPATYAAPATTAAPRLLNEPSDGSYFISSVRNGMYISNVSQMKKNAVCALTDEHRETLTVRVKKTDGNVTLAIHAGTAGKKDWVVESAEDGYVIRNAADRSEALTANSDGSVTLEEYTGSASQLWKLEEAHHNIYVKSTVEATCTTDGNTVYACSECDFAYTESEPQTGHDFTEVTVKPGKNSYGFTKCTCQNCGLIERKDVKEKKEPTALVDTGEIRQMSSGFVYVSTDVTEEDLLDAFPGYEISGSPATCTGKTLAPKGVDSVPDRDLLTVVLPGDVDKDGKVSAGDARIVLRYCVSLESLNDISDKLAADLDFDGRVTTEDARWLLRTAVGYETGATTLAGIDVR